MRASSLCVLAVAGLAGVFAIHSDEHGVLLQTTDSQQVELDMAINTEIRLAQEAVLNEVSNGNVVTDGQIDAAVKAAFAPIFTKCEAITNLKEQRKCLLNVAAGKKITASGSKKAKKAKKAKKVAANATVAKVAPVAPKKVVKKDAIAENAAKAKKHIAKAKALEAKAKKEKELAKKFEKKMEATLKKKAASVAKVAKAVKKDLKGKKDKKSKKNATKAEKKAEKKAASFLEFEAEIEDADMALEEVMGATRENIVAFLEVAADVAPHMDAEQHLDSIDISMIDVENLEIPEVNAEEIDSLVQTAETVASDDVASFLSEEEAQEAEAQEEAQEEAEETAEEEVHAEAEAPVSLIDAESDEARAHESEASLIAAAEAEMNRDLSNLNNENKKDVIDLADLEDIEHLDV